MKKIKTYVYFLKGIVIQCILLLQLSAITPKINAFNCPNAQQVFEEMDYYCIQHSSEHYCIELHVADRFDAQGNQILHSWDLGDGVLKYGSRLEHCYEKFGHYEVKLLSERNIDGYTVIDTTVQSVDINEIVIIQEIKQDRLQYFFDGSNSYIDNDFKIENYYWDFGDGNYQCNMIVMNTFPKSGLYEIKLIVEGRAKDGRMRRICGKKKFFVR